MLNKINKRYLFLIAGHIGSGKTTTKQFLHEQGYVSLEMGDYFKQKIKFSTSDRAEILQQIKKTYCENRKRNHD